MPAGVSEEPTTDHVPRSIARLLDIIELAVENSPANLSTVADAAALTPTTTLRYLRALEQRGYLARQPDGSYAPGGSLARLAAEVAGFDRIERLVVRAQPFLDSLADQTGESVYLAVIDGTDAKYLATSQSDRPIRHVGYIGQRVPLAGSAVGEALTNPATTVHRVGAVEAEIAAVARGEAARDGFVFAVSVIGPAHRYDPGQVQSVAAALESLVPQLGREARLSDGGDYR